MVGVYDMFIVRLWNLMFFIFIKFVKIKSICERHASMQHTLSKIETLLSK